MINWNNVFCYSDQFIFKVLSPAHVTLQAPKKICCTVYSYLEVANK